MWMQGALKRVVKGTLQIAKSPVTRRGQIGDARAGIICRCALYHRAADETSKSDTMSRQVTLSKTHFEEPIGASKTIESRSIAESKPVLVNTAVWDPFFRPD
jgi:hypothetical protein